MDRGSWQITVRRVVESRTRLNDYHFHFILIIDVSVELPFLIFVCLFYFWLCWVFIAVCGVSLLAVSEPGLLSGCGTQTRHCSDFSHCRAWINREQRLQ